MDFQSPLFRASFIERVSLVLADACLENGDIVTAYCSNVSRMKTLTEPGTEIFLSFNRKPGRRLLYTWETAAVSGTLVGVNEGRNFDLIVEGIQNGVLRELAGYGTCERIIPSRGTSLFDLRLTPVDERYPVCKAAVGPVYLKKGVDLLYPDSVYVSNRRILPQMASALENGERVVLILLAQRIDALGIRADWAADSEYVAGLKDLCDKGLEILCYGCSVSAQGIWVTARLPFMF